MARRVSTGGFGFGVVSPPLAAVTWHPWSAELARSLQALSPRRPLQDEDMLIEPARQNRTNG